MEPLSTPEAEVLLFSDCAFIVSLCCAYEVMTLTIMLLRSLQKVNQDLFQAVDSVDFVRTPQYPEKWRQGGGDHSDTNDDEWETDDGVYGLVSRFAQTANVTLTMPRLNSARGSGEHCSL